MSSDATDCTRAVAHAFYKEFNPNGTDDDFDREWKAMGCKLPIPEGFKDAQFLRHLRIDQEQQKLRGEGASPELAPPLSPTAISNAKKRAKEDEKPNRVKDIKSRFDAIEFKLDTFMYELRGFTPADRNERVRMNALCVEAIQSFTKAVADIAQLIDAYVDAESD